MARNYKREYKNYHSKPEQKKNRAKRNAARRKMTKKLGKSAVRGKDIDHKKPLRKGGSNKMSNLRVMSKRKNRSRK